MKFDLTTIKNNIQNSIIYIWLCNFGAVFISTAITNILLDGDKLLSTFFPNNFSKFESYYWNIIIVLGLSILVGTIKTMFDNYETKN